MSFDVMTLGGIVFDDFSTPETMMGGGNQALVTTKLPGGARVIDTLGPDDADIQWRGFFYGNNAYATALALDAIRAAGKVIPLMWGGQFRSVILSHFVYRVKRLPVWVEYDLSCTVASNPALGSLGISISSTDALVGGDLSGGAAAAAGAASGGVVGDAIPSTTGSIG
jgi:hypothetical protein